MKNIYTSRKVQRNNYSGKTGVFWNPINHKWISRIRFAGVDRHLGSYKDFEDAVEAREVAEYACNLLKGLEVTDINVERSKTELISISAIVAGKQIIIQGVQNAS